MVDRNLAFRSLGLAALASLFWVGAEPTTADVLVLQDGSRIETLGPIESKGRQVVFTTAAGQLSAVRQTEVDFEATAAANDPSRDASSVEGEASAAAAVPREVIVLTKRQLGEAQSSAFPPNKPPVLMYSAEWCGVCRKAQAFFRELDVRVEEVDIDRVEGARAEKQRADPSCRGVPLIVIGDGTVCGFSSKRVRELLAPLLEAREGDENMAG